MQVEIILDVQATLGEGPAWDAKTDTLYWVDILQKRYHYHHRGENGYFRVDNMPGCLAPCKDGTFLAALSGTDNRHNYIAKLETFDLAGGEPATVKQTTLTAIIESANNRFNDGKCDPAGRFLVGTVDRDEKAPSGALYSFDGVQVTCLLEEIRISNGLAWSPDYKTFYYIDTPTREVKAFDYDLETGYLANPRTAVSVPEALGWPDGMTSDTEGNLWIAQWGGACVTRWDARNGDLLERIPLPAKNISCCVFGGAHLNELYVTSARKGLDNADLTAYRYSGSLMRVQTRVQGLPTFEFG